MGINYVLVLAIILIAVLTFVGRRVGGGKILFVYIILAVSIFAAGIIDSGIYRALDFAGVTDDIYNVAAGRLLSEDAAVIYGADSENISSKINAETAYIQKLPASYDIRLMLIENNNSKIYEKLGAESFPDYICRYSAYVITAALSLLFAALVSVLGVLLLFKAVGITKHFKSGKEINKVTGAMGGFVLGVLFVCLLLAIVSLAGSTASGGWMYNQIKSSRILSWLYNNNIVVKAFLLAKIPVWIAIK